MLNIGLKVLAKKINHSNVQILPCNVFFQILILKVKMANGLELSFTTVDYAVFGIMLVISFGIGVYHAFMSPTTKEG